MAVSQKIPHLGNVVDSDGIVCSRGRSNSFLLLSVRGPAMQAHKISSIYNI